MKSIETLISIAAALVMAGPANAQSAASDSGIYEQAEAPKTARMRVADLKTRHGEARTELSTALGRIPTDPTQVTSAETFAAIDKADRDMRRSIAASDAIRAAINAEMTAIKSDSAFSDEQKAELEAAAKAMADECSAVRSEAGLVMKNLAKAYKLFPKWKRIYKSYLNLQGEAEANSKLKSAVESYLGNLASPENAAGGAEPAGGKPGNGVE